MDGIAVLVAIIVVVGAVAGVVLAVTFAFRMRKRIFRGPARDAWELTRVDLSQADQRHVRRATSKRRPVNRGYLAPAQLVYSRYAQFTVERSPLRQPRIRIGLTVLYLVWAVVEFVSGATTTHAAARLLKFGVGGYAVAMAVLFGLWLTWWMDRQPARLKQLRRAIRRRWPEDWA